MQFWNKIPQNLVWVFLISSMLSSLASSTFDDRLSEAEINCGTSKYPDDGKRNKTLNALMDVISEKVSDYGWGVASIDDHPHAMYALSNCHRDLHPNQCADCFTRARELLYNECLPFVSGQIHLDGCFLRYENYTFFNDSLNPARDRNNCQSPRGSLNKKYLKPGFLKQVQSVISNVTERAAKNKFAVGGERGGVEAVFALAQCWETLNQVDCKKCLQQAGNNLSVCVPDSEGRALYAGCYLRYSTRKFFDETAELVSTNPVGSSTQGMIVGGVLSGIAVILLLMLGAFLSWRNIASKREIKNDFGNLPSFAYKDGLNFRYELLEKATDHFDPSRKLGQGGAGSVFQGTLPSGRTVAVKRLHYNTRQWADEFFNEVNLISGIQHNNLVKLLGCSIEGPESLLVYEFVPNRSLDQMLFGKSIVDALTWEQRHQIICGIADGLAFLHEGCRRKIVHRDIKSSNILLDENLNPKIADFGLARAAAPDKSHISTGIAGTLGYMAPEYIIRGQLTEKADNYAFGVLVVEIVCGKKNSVFTGSTSILHCVWKDYKAKNITASIDPALQGQFSVQEASNALLAGLLCTQSSIALRPSMSEVVQMLSNKDYVVPSPKQPPFLNASVLSPDELTTCSIESASSINASVLSPGERPSFYSTRSSSHGSFSSTTHSINVDDPESIGAPEPR